MTVTLFGIDLAPGGWFVVKGLWDDRFYELEMDLVGSFEGVLDRIQTATKAVIAAPLSLPDSKESHPRICDKLAKKVLGNRSPSLITAPVRSWLKATDYDQVKSKGISKESFGLFSRIREIEFGMTPQLETVLKEGNPDLSYLVMNMGTPLLWGKKNEKGISERLNCLHESDFFEPNLIDPFSNGAVNYYSKRLVAMDDALDALALLVTSMRIYLGVAQSLPLQSEPDSKGVSQAIWL